MALHTRKCTICGYTTDVVTKASESNMPVGCKNPEFECPGIMEIVWSQCSFNLGKGGVPTRNLAGATYKVNSCF